MRAAAETSIRGRSPPGDDAPRMRSSHHGKRYSILGLNAVSSTQPPASPRLTRGWFAVYSEREQPRAVQKPGTSVWPTYAHVCIAPSDGMLRASCESSIPSKHHDQEGES